jgi:hypothetical protein
MCVNCGCICADVNGFSNHGQARSGSTRQALQKWQPFCSDPIMMSHLFLVMFDMCDVSFKHFSTLSVWAIMIIFLQNRTTIDFFLG